ncbi:MAG: response regulator [Gammaproteobacteria bacterium]|nr:response regulator [Gammaproteobacteria bacterium]
MITTNGISAYYYPTLAVLVDDSERFLTTISLQLDTNLAYVTFSDPEQALKFVTQKTPNSLAEKCLAENGEAGNFGVQSTEHDVKLNLSKLYQQIYNAERFNETSVIVVDYSMPNMNGMKFCKSIRELNKSIKIILLTGEADEGKGVEMFNAELIHRFISKNSPGFGEQVSSAIAELQRNYFESQSKLIIQNLSTKASSCLHETTFIKVFHEIIRKHRIVEYYLIENTGSFLLLKFDGTPIWLLVSSDTELQEYCDIAKDYHAPPEILKLLKEGQKIPYFKNPDEYMKMSGVHWEAHLHTAQKIQGENTTYYYALVKEEELFPIEKENVLSYKEYMETVWPPI